MAKHIGIVFKILLLISFFTTACQPVAEQGKELESGFLKPPPEARTHVWWHWISGHISRDGITKDLEAMAEKGIGGATIFNVGLNDDLFADQLPVYDFMTPEWRKLIQFAMQEAERLGLELIVHNCDGWSTAGGPWVKPHEAMKTVTFNRVLVKGPASYREILPEPASNLDFYEDIALLAYPSQSTGQGTMHEYEFKLTSNAEIEDIYRLADRNINSHAVVHLPDNREPVSLVISFSEPFPAQSITIADDGFNQGEVPKQCRLEYSPEGKNYIKIREFTMEGPHTTVTFKEVSARDYRLTFLTPGFARGLQYRIPEIELLSQGGISVMPKINDFEVKAGYWIRRRYLLKPATVPESWIIDQDQVLDISASMDENGTLEWDVPEGEWEILRVGYTLTGKTNGPGTTAGVGLECDKLDTRFVEAFFNGMPRALIEDNQSLAGISFTHFLTDSWEAYCQNWTDRFPEEFQQRREYDITPFLPVLCGEVVGSVEISERFLFDFRQTIAELIRENFYAKLNELCNQSGLKYQSEASGAQQHLFDPISYQSMIDEPMTEFWVMGDEEFPRIRLNGGVMGAVSAGHIYNKNIVAAEAFTSSKGNWKQTPYNLKPSGDAALALGMNKFTFHDYAHQPDETVPGWQMVPWGIAMNRKITWWDQSHAWLTYLSRCQYMLRQGQFVADALAFHGEGAPVAMHYAYMEDSIRRGPRADGHMEHLDAIRNITPFGYAWDGCNDETIMDRLEVKDNRLILPHGPDYRVLILPPNESMTSEMLRALKDLIMKGAVIYGPRPLKSPSLENYPECDLEVANLANEIWGDINGKDITENRLGKGKLYWGLPLEEVLKKQGIQPDFEYAPRNQNSDLMYAHRRTGQTEIYFISNQANREESIDCWFRAKDRQPEIWDPATGEILICAQYEQERERVKVPLKLDPYGSVFVVFRNPARKSITGVEIQGIGAMPDHLVRYERDELIFSTGLEGIYLLNTSADQVREVQVGPIPEPVHVNGGWNVSFPEDWGAPSEIMFDRLISWSDHPETGIKYFSGTASYQKELEIPEEMLAKNLRILLNLGDVRDLAEVHVNGQNLGVLWKVPFSLAVTGELRPGKNILEIRVTNVWTNRLIGDELGPQDQRFTQPITRMHYDESREQVLRPSGLLGPVTFTVEQEERFFLD